MRMIDADKLYDNVRMRCIKDNCETCEDVFDAKDYFLQTIVNQPTVNQWIPCSEKLPKDGDMVLATIEDMVMELYYIDGRWRTVPYCIPCETNPIAWQPLLEPYGWENYGK